MGGGGYYLHALNGIMCTQSNYFRKIHILISEYEKSAQNRRPRRA